MFKVFLADRHVADLTSVQSFTYHHTNCLCTDTEKKDTPLLVEYNIGFQLTPTDFNGPLLRFYTPIPLSGTS